MSRVVNRPTELQCQLDQLEFSLQTHVTVDIRGRCILEYFVPFQVAPLAVESFLVAKVNVAERRRCGDIDRVF